MKIAILFGLAAVVLPALAIGQEPGTPTTPIAAPHTAETPFASEIAAFEASDKVNPSAPGGVLFVGSSSIRLWTTLAQDFPELPTLNRGFGGSQIADSILYVDRIVIPYKPRMIVFYAGTNDLNAGKSPQQVFQDFQTFATKVRTDLPDTHLVYISINPSVARWKQETNILETNRMIENYIRHDPSRPRKLYYINSHSGLLRDGKPQPTILREDGLHLNAQGYKKWTAILRPKILAIWKASTK